MKRYIAALALVAMSASPADLILMWDANDEPLTASYKIYAAVDHGPWLHVGTVNHPTNWFVFTPTNQGLHAFQVTAIDTGDSETGPSNILLCLPNNRKLATAGTVNAAKITINVP